MTESRFHLALAACVVLTLGTACAYDGPLVVDHANFLDGEGLLQLSQSVKSLNTHSDFFLVILTVPTLSGEDADLYSRAVLQRWQIGHEGQNDGVLLLAVKDPPTFRFTASAGAKGRLESYPLSDITTSLAISYEQKDYLGGLTRAVSSLESGAQSERPRVTYALILIPVAAMGLVAFANTFNLKRRKCPHCGRRNLTSAVRCIYCLRDMWCEENKPCPCGSRKTYEQCCLPYHLDGTSSYRIRVLRFLDLRYYTGLSTGFGGFTAGGPFALPKASGDSRESDCDTETGGW